MPISVRLLTLEEDGALVEINAIALKRVLAWQIEQAMVEKKLTKTKMANEMKTSRASLLGFLTRRTHP